VVPRRAMGRLAASVLWASLLGHWVAEDERSATTTDVFFISVGKGKAELEADCPGSIWRDEVGTVRETGRHSRFSAVAFQA